MSGSQGLNVQGVQLLLRSLGRGLIFLQPETWHSVAVKASDLFLSQIPSPAAQENYSAHW